LPNTKSAAKALRVSERRHLRNKSTKAAVKTFVRKAEDAISAGGDQVADTIRRAVSALDRAAEKNILHRNNVARRKSRLMKKLNTAAAVVPEPVAAAPKRRSTRATTKPATSVAKTPAAATDKPKRAPRAKAATAQ
jgi:small subunit ribosomal protein S20